MGLTENSRGAFGETDHLGQLKMASEKDERPVLGEAHDTQQGELPHVVPGFKLPPQTVELPHLEAEDN